MKKFGCFFAITCIFLSLIILVCSCAVSPTDNTDNTQSNNTASSNSINDSKPQIISINDNKPTGTSIEFSVDKTKETLELFSLVKATNGAVWKVYDTNNNLIANKVITLNNGNNIYYIEIALPDGSYSTTYTLKIFKSYDITVTYVWWEFITEHVLKKVTIEQGELFKADYVPDIFGYDFISWHDYSFDVGFTEGISAYDFKLVAKVSPKPAKLHLIVEGEEWKTINTEYGKWINLPIPEKEHYHFGNNGEWYTDSSFCGSITKEYRCYSWGDIYIYGKFEPNAYTITYDYGEMRNNYKHFQSVRYGQDFNIIEPNVHYVTENGIKYVFSGYTFNGEPFESGKYFYDGNITVEAIWLPAES